MNYVISNKMLQSMQVILKAQKNQDVLKVRGNLR